MKILVAGDLCPRERIQEAFTKGDYSAFDEIKSIVDSADYSIVNLECPVVVGDVEPIKKCGPALRTDKSVISAIKYAGFDCATLANNHFRDFGSEGCKTTLEELGKQNIDFVGGGNNLQEAQKILYKDINGKRLGIVNFCENEFSIATQTEGGAAPLDAVDNYHQITEARKNADYVLVIVHGGHEHYQLPSPRMKKLYRHFISLGADAVVNHHQHCYSGYEFFEGKPIVYGLGNFCLDEKDGRNKIWNEGYCVVINFAEKGIEIKQYPYVQCNESPTIALMRNNHEEKFFNNINELNMVISDDQQLQKTFEEWINIRHSSVVGLFASYHNRYLNAAAHRGWIPRIIKQNEIGAMLNYVACEAHRDITIEVLNRLMHNKK